MRDLRKVRRAVSPQQLKKIREQLGLTQDDLAKVLGLAGKKTISHFETGFRTPSPLISAVMSYLESLPDRKAAAFIEEFQRHIDEAQKSNKGRSRG
jgi:DNA-binding XRE family transcriptional regulator